MKNISYCLNRFLVDDSCTLGVLTSTDGFECFTLEDTARKVKVKGETCIPSGTYKVILRTDSSPKNDHYKKLYGDFHKGMLWLQNVENFEYVYIHVGNTKNETEGCILVGLDSYGSDHRIGRSMNAYKSLYAKMSKQILDGDTVTLDIVSTYPATYK